MLATTTVSPDQFILFMDEPGIAHMNVLRYIVDALIVLTAIASMHMLAEKATLPHDVPSDMTNVHSTRIPVQGARDVVLKGEHRNYVLAKHEIGDVITYATPGSRSRNSARLEAEYSTSFIVMQTILCMIFGGLGLFVLFNQRSSTSARSFHDLAWSTVAVLVCTTVHYRAEGDAFSGIMAALHAASYAVFAVMLVRFTTSFPTAVPGMRFVMLGTVVLATGIGIGGAASGFEFGVSPDPSQWVSLSSVAVSWMSAARLLFVASAVVSISSLVYTVRTTRDVQHQKQAWWILYGAAVSILGTVIFWILPLILFDTYLVPEWVLLMMVAVAPITFAIAVVRYRALDISIVLRRSTAYAIIALVLISTIILVSRIISSWFISADDSLAHPGTWIIIALTAMIYEPLRKRVQRFVDHRLFGVHYDLREAKATVASHMAALQSVREVALELTRLSESYFRPERIGVFNYSSSTSMLLLVNDLDFEVLRGRRIPFDALHVHASLLRPVTRTGMVESDLDVEPADPAVFDRWGMAVAVPMTGAAGTLLGFLVLGPKRTGVQYAENDIELLRFAGQHAGHAWERIQLQEALRAEQMEAERLAEVSALKSMFVSSVSHDLKTPITAIRLYAEMSGSTNDQDTLKRNMDVIVGESARLSHMIDNILGMARADQGLQQVVRETIDMNDVVERTAALLRYQTDQTQTTLRITLPEEPVFVRGNQDLLVQALVNIIENCMKYARDDRRIDIELSTSGDRMQCSVTDHGPGFTAEALPHVFEPFYRSKHHVSEERVSGTGLGLAIVQYVAHLHDGTVEASNASHGGARIILSLPRMEDL